MAYATWLPRMLSHTASPRCITRMSPTPLFSSPFSRLSPTQFPAASLPRPTAPPFTSHTARFPTILQLSLAPVPLSPLPSPPGSHSQAGLGLNSRLPNHPNRQLFINQSTAGQQSFSTSPRDYPTHARVGIGIVVFRPSPTHPAEIQVLVIKRGREPNKGMWSFPGGGLELGETMVECAVREVLEETGIAIRNEAPPGLRLVWSSTLSFPTAFAAVDLIEHGTGPDQSRIKYHYCIVDLAALAQDPAQEPTPGDDAEVAVWISIQQLSELEDLSEGCNEVAQEAVRIFNVPLLLKDPAHSVP